MLKPFYEIRMVKENLDLSMALLQAVQEEKVTAKQLFRDGPEGMFVAFAVGTLSLGGVAVFLVSNWRHSRSQGTNP